MSETTTVDLAQSIMAGWSKFLEKDQKAGAPHSYCYASQYHPCALHLLYAMTRAQDLPPFPAEVLAKFRRGNDRERNLLSDLMLIGRDADPPFEVVGGQERFELKDRKGRTAIVGKVDARLRFKDGHSYPLEVKSWSPMLVDRVKVYEDLFDNRWTRAGAHQILAYLLGSGEEQGFMLLDRQGLPLLLTVRLWENNNHERIDRFLSLAEEALDGEDIAYYSDAEECKACKFYGSVCTPPLVSNGASILQDEELEAALKRREELKELAKEYGKLDDQVKERLRGVEMGLCGEFLIEGKYSKQTLTVVPTEYLELFASWKKVDPKGKFTLKITKI